jgi:hypothetical protein
MLEIGTITDKFVVDTKDGRAWILTILMKNGIHYHKKISKSTYDKKKIGNSFQYFVPSRN